MGHNFSAIHGVKSDNFYQQGNAINEIWIGDLELVARLPFGDSDLGQAGWPLRNWPKIPWHQFVIPLKRDMTSYNATVPGVSGLEACSLICNKPISGIFAVLEPSTSSNSPLFWGITLTIMGTGVLIANVLSNDFAEVISTMLLARRQDPAGARAWFDRIGGTSLRSFFAVTLHYLGPTLIRLSFGGLFLAIGTPLLYSKFGQLVLMKHIFWMIILQGVLACIIGATLFCCFFSLALWTIINRRRRTRLGALATLEDSSKPAPDGSTSVPGVPLQVP